MTYAQAGAALRRQTVSAVQPGLQRTKRLLRILNHPEQAFPTIQITGTNGKGSVAALLSSVLSAAGYRVGRFTSPHLADERERIQIAGRMVSKKEFARAVEQMLLGLKQLQHAREPATMFEAWTILAAVVFGSAQVDIAIVEVGMGGRWDATTAWKNRVLTLLTNIQLEHTAYLGKNKYAICREKLGITRPGIPLLCAEKTPELRNYIQAWGSKKKLPVLFAGQQAKDAVWIKEQHPFQQRSKVVFCSRKRMYGPMVLSLAGTFQICNAALAILALEQLVPIGFSVSEAAMAKGLRSVIWPGRMEQICRKPRIILDGAHNPAAILGSAQQWRLANRKVNIIVGIMKDKDITSMCRALLPVADTIITVATLDARAMSAADLAKTFAGLGKSAVPAENFGQAVKLALQTTSSQQTILITGSLYNIEPARRAVKNLHLGV